MKVIIAGSRCGCSDEEFSKGIKSSGFDITEVVSGTARGIDTMGENWAYDKKIPVAQFPANWDRHGKSAGYKRNTEMAEYADALIAFWDGESNGTRHMINIARNKKLPLHIHNIPK